MKDKGILKFRGTESRGVMHFIKYNNTYVSITKKTSRKVKHIKKNNTLSVAFNILSKDFNDILVDINEDEIAVKQVFEYMKSQKHTHYKKTPEDLVVLTYVNLWYNLLLKK